MKHKFKFVCYDKNYLLEDCKNLSTFMRRLSKQSEEKRGMGWTSDEYKGMAFEAFVEVLVSSSPVDKRINITDYRPHSVKLDGPDMGIDGYGTSHNGNKHTVQIKFRSNTQRNLTTEDMISNFVAKTTSDAALADADMTLFTTAKGLGFKISEDMYHNRVRTLGYEELSQLVDDNQAFWNIFRAEMQ